MAAVGRFDRSRRRSIESIGSVGSVILRIFGFFCHVGELEICLVSMFQLRTTPGGRKNAENSKRKFSEFFGSAGSVFHSVRSILRPRTWWTALAESFAKLFLGRDVADAASTPQTNDGNLSVNGESEYLPSVVLI